MMQLPGFTAEASVRFAGEAYPRVGSLDSPALPQITLQRRRAIFSSALICSGIRGVCEENCLEGFVIDLDTSNPGPALEGYGDCMGQCRIDFMICNAYGVFYI